MTESPKFAPNSTWRDLIDDATARIDSGQHPDDATWGAVMDATTTDDAALDVLYRTSPDPDALYYDDVDSDDAEKQSVILGNLHQFLRL